jgi:hypothetical protein
VAPRVDQSGFGLGFERNEAFAGWHGLRYLETLGLMARTMSIECPRSSQRRHGVAHLRAIRPDRALP